MQFIISQILGGIALILVCISYFCNKKIFLLIQTLANIFYGAGFIVSLSLVAGINTFVSIIRTTLYFIFEKRNKEIPKYFILIFAIVYITVGIIFFKSPWDIITIISPILFTTAMAFKKMIVVNLLMLLPNLMLLSFCLGNAFYTSAVLDAIEAIIIVVAILTYVIKKYKEKKTLMKLI